jgi:hypothetical protein
MSSGDNPREIIIIGTGKDFSSKEYRAIKVVYSKEAIQAAIQAPVIGGAGNANVYWGPMMSLSSLDLSGGANELFPRKYARAAITANGTYDTRDIVNDSTNKGPYTDNVFTEWWSFNEPPGVPDILTPDTSYYAQLSQDQEAFTGEDLYHETSWSINNLQDGVCTVDLGLGNGPEPKVRFSLEDMTFGGSKYFCGILIAYGQITFNSGGKHPLGSITVDPPTEAWKEYQVNVVEHKGDTGAGAMNTWDFSCPGAPPTHPCSEPHGDTDEVDEYPGDSGYQDLSPYNFKSGRTATNKF